MREITQATQVPIELAKSETELVTLVDCLLLLLLQDNDYEVITLCESIKARAIYGKLCALSTAAKKIHAAPIILLKKRFESASQRHFFLIFLSSCAGKKAPYHRLFVAECDFQPDDYASLLRARRGGGVSQHPAKTDLNKLPRSGWLWCRYVLCKEEFQGLWNVSTFPTKFDVEKAADGWPPFTKRIENAPALSRTRVVAHDQFESQEQSALQIYKDAFRERMCLSQRKFSFSDSRCSVVRMNRKGVLASPAVRV